MGARHTVESANVALLAKGLTHLRAVEIDHVSEVVQLVDDTYGAYQIDLKSLAPTTDVPIHKVRKHKAKLALMRAKYVGQQVNGLTVTNVFYGPDHGYKNRSFYIAYDGTCGHTGVDTYATLTKHRKNFVCRSCFSTQHGARGKVDGVRIKRTPTYIFWTKVKASMPEKYKDFETFRSEVGDKPYKIADLHELNGRFVWINLQIEEDADLNLIATAVRQAFRHSSIAKAALERVKVETVDGTRYRCALCKELFRRADIEIDHVEPIAEISGNVLQRSTLLDRIWTDQVQILDTRCHTKKSAVENSLRRQNKKEKAKKNVR